MCQYHIDHLVCKAPTPSPAPSPQPKMKLKLKAQNPQKIINDLEKEVARLKGENTALKENPQTVTNNNNVIVFPSTFGKEDMKHIQEILGDILKPMISNHTFRSIPILFDTIHKNKKLPEYHNVYVANERSKFAMVSDGKSFEYKPKKTIIDQIIEDKRSILEQYVEDNEEKLGGNVLAKYERYRNKLDEKDSKLREELEVEIASMLLNMKSVIANDEKTRKLLVKVDQGQFELTDNIDDQ
jgi:hypothetical protein